MPRIPSMLLILSLMLCLPHAAPGSPAEGLTLRPPAGFAELPASDQLYVETEQQSVAQGRLWKMFLPQHMARQYRHGSRDLVTRQVILCTPGGQDQQPLTAKDAEILAKVQEGLFAGFARVPRGRLDTPAMETEHRQAALDHSFATGTPFLSESIRYQAAWIYTYLIHYDMDPREHGNFLTTAMATAVIPVRDTVLFAHVSSILEGRDASAELEWVKDVAMSFTGQILSDNGGAGR
ncbi:MAG: hypothetical protein J6P53_00375 [Mailhella sp.]|nr:hypothetical protein [Mailhella sp.]